MPTVFSDLGRVVVNFDKRRVGVNLLSAFPQAFRITDVNVLDWHLNKKPEAESLLTRFERGHVHEDEFRNGVVKLLSEVLTPQGAEILKCSGEIFWRAHCDIFEVNMPVAMLLQNLWQSHPGTRLFALSNTDIRRWPYIWAMANLPFVNGIFSFRVGMMKPEPGIFRRAINMSGESAKQCFFTDDILENVDIARSLGMCAHHYDVLDVERDIRLQGALQAFLSEVDG